MKVVSSTNSIFCIHVSDLNVTHNYTTNELHAEGIQISELTATPLQWDDSDIIYDGIEFTPLSNSVHEVGAFSIF